MAIQPTKVLFIKPDSAGSGERLLLLASSAGHLNYGDREEKQSQEHCIMQQCHCSKKSDSLLSQGLYFSVTEIQLVVLTGQVKPYQATSSHGKVIYFIVRLKM